MRGRRISKRVLASLVGIVVGVMDPSPMIVRSSYGRGRAMVGDDYYDSGLSSRAIAAAVIQRTRMLRQAWVIQFSSYSSFTPCMMSRLVVIESKQEQ
ncbi:hypothetical protein AVEN_7844-1 [Araneus ventricosus]|uniref:Uncharacterized protein n=1 Tax=Araneus ventricosus TaxID=182803 RepID=A0A4Y2F3Z9_ARAVE|nr:hypothetical protein AVEN_7844-1 [Araneus ventricosus]